MWNIRMLQKNVWARYLSRYSVWPEDGRSGGIESRWGGARFSAPVQTGPGAHPASCTMRTGSFSGVKSDRSVTLTPHPLLVPWSWKSRAIPPLPLWAVRPVQSLSVCTRVTFTFSFFKRMMRYLATQELYNHPGCRHTLCQAHLMPGTPYVRQTTAWESELRDNYAAYWRSITPLTSVETLIHCAVRTPQYAMSTQNITRV